MQIISKAHHEHVERYGMSYSWLDDANSGFSFPCDKEGNIFTEEIPVTAKDNLRKCQDGTYAVECTGVQDYSYSYLVHAIGRCSCGRNIELADFTNECDCGLLYNSCGQSLAPYSVWKYEYLANC